MPPNLAPVSEGQAAAPGPEVSKLSAEPSDDIKPAPETLGDAKAVPSADSTTSDPASAPNETVIEDTHVFNPADPLNFGRHRRHDTSLAQLKSDHPNAKPKKVKRFYTRQNKMIDQFLNADDEERLAVEEDVRVGPKIRFAVNASFVANFCLFVIQLYAAVSTGSLSVWVCPNKIPGACADTLLCSSLRQLPMPLLVSLSPRVSGLPD